jgi:hypothetical protein
VLFDQTSLGTQRRPKVFKLLNQQVNFCQTRTSGAGRAKEKFELDATTTVSDRQHVMAPLVLPASGRFSLGKNVRRVAG